MLANYTAFSDPVMLREVLLHQNSEVCLSVCGGGHVVMRWHVMAGMFSCVHGEVGVP